MTIRFDGKVVLSPVQAGGLVTRLRDALLMQVRRLHLTT